MKLLAVALLLLVAVEARPSHHRRHRIRGSWLRSGEVEDEESCSYVQSFSQGRKYVYNYEALIKQPMEESKNPENDQEESEDDERMYQTLRMNCQVELAIIRRCEASMKIRDCEIRSSPEEARPEGSEIEQLSRYDTLFSFEKGAIIGVKFHIEEPIEMKNLKRGILSTIQMQFSNITSSVHEEFTYTVREMSIQGIGLVQHTVVDVVDRYAYRVEVMRDANELKLPWEREHINMGHLSLEEENPIYRIIGDYVKESFSESLERPVQRCVYTLERGRTVIVANCTEIHSYNSSNTFWRRIASNITHLDVVVEQNLEKKSIERMTRSDKENLQDSSAFKEDKLMFEYNWDETEPAVRKYFEPIPKLHALINEPIDANTPIKLAEIERWLTVATQEEIERVWEELTEHMKEENERKAIAIWAQLLAGCSSNYWCTGNKQNCTKNDQCEEALGAFITEMLSQPNEEQCRSVMLSLAGIPKPETPIVAAAHLICRSVTNAENVQLLGEVLQNHLRKNPESEEKEVVKAKRFLISLVDRGCSKDVQTEVIVAALHAIKIAGPEIESADNELVACIESESAPKVVVSSAIAALKNVTRHQPKPQIKRKLLSLFRNRRSSIETKILCYDYLMSKSLTLREVKQVLQQSLSGDDEEVAHYVKRHLSTELLLRNTKFSRLQPEVAANVQKLLVGGKWNIDMEIEEINKEPTEKSEVYEREIFVPYLGMKVKSEVETTLIYQDESKMPILATVNVNAILDEKRVSLMEFGVDFLSLSSMLRENLEIDLSKPEGVFQLMNLPIEEVYSRAFSFNPRYQEDSKLNELQDKARYGSVNGMMRSTLPFYVNLFGEEITLESVFKTYNLRNFFVGNLWQIIYKLEEGFKNPFTATTNTPIYIGKVSPTSFGVPTTKIVTLSYLYQGKSEAKFDFFKMMWSHEGSGYADIEQQCTGALSITQFPIIKMCPTCLKLSAMEITAGHSADFALNVSKVQNELEMEFTPRKNRIEIISFGIKPNREGPENTEGCLDVDILGDSKLLLCNRMEPNNMLIGACIDYETPQTKVMKIRWGEKPTRSEEYEREFAVEIKQKEESEGEPMMYASISHIPGLNTAVCQIKAKEPTINWQARMNLFFGRNEEGKMNSMFTSCNCSSWTSDEIEYTNVINLAPPTSEGDYTLSGKVEVSQNNEKVSGIVRGKVHDSENLKYWDVNVYDNEESESPILKYQHNLTIIDENNFEFTEYGQGPAFLSWNVYELSYIVKQAEATAGKYISMKLYPEGEQNDPFYVKAKFKLVKTSPQSFVSEYTHADSWYQGEYKIISNEDIPHFKVLQKIYMPKSPVPIREVESENEQEEGPTLSCASSTDVPMLSNEIEMAGNNPLLKEEVVYRYKKEESDEMNEIKGLLEYSKSDSSCENCHSFKIEIPFFEISSENSDNEGRHVYRKYLKVHRSMLRYFIKDDESYFTRYITEGDEEYLSVKYDFIKTEEPTSYEINCDILNNNIKTLLKYENDDEIVLKSQASCGVPFWNVNATLHCNVNTDEQTAEAGSDVKLVWSGILHSYRAEASVDSNPENGEYSCIGKLYKEEKENENLINDCTFDISKSSRSVEGRCRNIAPQEIENDESDQSETESRYSVHLNDESGNMVDLKMFCSFENEDPNEPCLHVLFSLDNEDKFKYKMRFNEEEEEKSMVLTKEDDVWKCLVNAGEDYSFFHNLVTKMGIGPRVYMLELTNEDVSYLAKFENYWTWNIKYAESDNPEINREINLESDKYEMHSKCRWDYENSQGDSLAWDFVLKNRIFADISSFKNRLNMVMKRIPGMFNLHIENPDVMVSVKMEPDQPREVKFPWECNINVDSGIIHVNKLTFPIMGKPILFHINGAELNCPRLTSCNIRNINAAVENIYTREVTNVEGDIAINDQHCTVDLHDPNDKPCFILQTRLPVTPSVYGEAELHLNMDNDLFNLNVFHVYHVRENFAECTSHMQHHVKNKLSEIPKFVFSPRIEMKYSREENTNRPNFDLGFNLECSGLETMNFTLKTSDELCQFSARLSERSIFDSKVRMRGCSERSSFYGNKFCLPQSAEVQCSMLPVTPLCMFRDRCLMDTTPIEFSFTMQLKRCSGYLVDLWGEQRCMVPITISDGTLKLPYESLDEVVPFMSSTFKKPGYILDVSETTMKFTPTETGEYNIVGESQINGKSWETSVTSSSDAWEVTCKQSDEFVLHSAIRDAGDESWRWEMEVDSPWMEIAYTMEPMMEMACLFKSKGRLRDSMEVDMITGIKYAENDNIMSNLSFNTSFINTVFACNIREMEMTNMELYMKCPRTQYSTKIESVIKPVGDHNELEVNWEFGGNTIVSRFESTNALSKLTYAEAVLPSEELRKVTVTFIEVSEDERKCKIVMKPRSGPRVTCTTSAMSKESPEGTMTCTKGSQTVLTTKITIEDIPWMEESMFYDKFLFMKRIAKLWKVAKSNSAEELSERCRSELQISDRNLCSTLVETLKDLSNKRSEVMNEIVNSYVDTYPSLHDLDTIFQTVVDEIKEESEKYVSRYIDFNKLNIEMTPFTSLFTDSSKPVTKFSWDKSTEGVLHIHVPTSEDDTFTVNFNLNSTKFSWLKVNTEIEIKKSEEGIIGTCKTTLDKFVNKISTEFNGIFKNFKCECTWEEMGWTVEIPNREQNSEEFPIKMSFSKENNVVYRCHISVQEEHWEGSTITCHKMESGRSTELGHINFENIPDTKKMLKLTVDDEELDNYITETPLDENTEENIRYSVNEFRKYLLKCLHILAENVSPWDLYIEDIPDEYFARYAHKLNVNLEDVQRFYMDGESSWWEKISEMTKKFTGILTDYLSQYTEMVYGDISFDVWTNPEQKKVEVVFSHKSKHVPMLDLQCDIVLTMDENNKIHIETKINPSTSNIKVHSEIENYEVRNNITIGDENGEYVTRYLSLPNGNEEIEIKLRNEDSAYICKCKDSTNTRLQFNCYKSQRTDENYIYNEEEENRQPIMTFESDRSKFPFSDYEEDNFYNTMTKMFTKFSLWDPESDSDEPASENEEELRHLIKTYLTKRYITFWETNDDGDCGEECLSRREARYSVVQDCEENEDCSNEENGARYILVKEECDEHDEECQESRYMVNEDCEENDENCLSRGNRYMMVKEECEEGDGECQERQPSRYRLVKGDCEDEDSECSDEDGKYVMVTEDCDDDDEDCPTKFVMYNEDEDENDIIMLTKLVAKNTYKRLMSEMSDTDKMTWQATGIKTAADIVLNLFRPVLRPLISMCLQADVHKHMAVMVNAEKTDFEGLFTSKKYKELDVEYSLYCPDVRCIFKYKNAMFNTVGKVQLNTIIPMIEAWKIELPVSQGDAKIVPSESSPSTMTWIVTDDQGVSRKCAVTFSFSSPINVECYREEQSSESDFRMDLSHYDIFTLVRFSLSNILHYNEITSEVVSSAVERTCEIGDEKLKQEIIEHLTAEAKLFSESARIQTFLLYESIFQNRLGSVWTTLVADSLPSIYEFTKSMYKIEMPELVETCVRATEFSIRQSWILLVKFEKFVDACLEVARKGTLPVTAEVIEAAWTFNHLGYIVYKSFEPVQVQGVITRTSDEIQIVPFGSENYYKIPECALTDDYLLATDSWGESFSVILKRNAYQIVLPSCVLEMTDDFRLYHSNENSQRTEIELPYEDNHEENMPVRCYRNEEHFACTTRNVTVKMETSEDYSGITFISVGQKCLENTAGLLGSPLDWSEEEYVELSGIVTSSYRNFVTSTIARKSSQACPIEEEMRNSSISREVSSRVCREVFENAEYWYNTVPSLGYLKACEDNCQTEEEACLYANEYVEAVRNQGVLMPEIPVCNRWCKSEEPTEETIKKVEVNIIVSLSEEEKREFPEIEETLNNLVEALRSVPQSEEYSFRLFTVCGRELMYIPQQHTMKGRVSVPFSEQSWRIPFDSGRMEFVGPECRCDNVVRCINEARRANPSAQEGFSKIFLILAPHDITEENLTKRAKLKDILEDDLIQSFVLSPEICKTTGTRSASKFGIKSVFDQEQEERCLPDARAAAEFIVGRNQYQIGEKVECRCEVDNWFTGESVTVCNQPRE